MKVFHFVLLFILFFIITIIKIDVTTGKLKTIENEKNMLTSSLDTATSDTIEYLSKTDSYGTNSVNRTEVINTFLTSFYASMGIVSNEAAKEEMQLYIPVFLFCDTDGYYVNYYDEFKDTDGNIDTKRIWSEKMPYFYQDHDFIYRFTLTDIVSIYDVNHLLSADNTVININYHELQGEDKYKDFRTAHSDCILLKDDIYELVKKEAILNQLEEVMAYYTSKHNLIAQHQGITYTFSFPSGDTEEWAKYIEDVNLTIVFQGYPYGMGHNYSYNKIISAGANVSKKTMFYIEKKGWYYLAHKQGCPRLEQSTTVLDEAFDSLEECARMGAYCCSECIGNGSRVPKLN